MLTASTVGGMLTAHAGGSADPRFVSLNDAHKGTLEIDLRIMNQFGVQPQELQDFYTACRAAMTGMTPESDVADLCRKFKRRKLGGPMLGGISATGVAVWMHLPEADTVKVVVSASGNGASQIFASGDAARIFSVRCEGLAPDTAYVYQVMASDNTVLGAGQFVTVHAELCEKPFRIAFGADFHKIGVYRPDLMQLIEERGCRAMFLIGDSAVDGRKDNFGMINADYLLRNLSPPWQKLVANVPVSATWDDHDYYGNDISGQSDNQKKPIDVDGLRRVWKTQWNNPQRDRERKGIYFETRIGPVHYIALDTRSCRVNEERGKLNSFLGEAQMQWLRQQISESTSPCILLSSGTMWSDYITKAKDSWGTWDKEGRESIFKLIDKKRGSLVLLLSGDRHGARGFAIPRPDGGQIIELEVGTLGGVPGPDAFGDNREAQLFGHPSGTWAFGELTLSQAESQAQAVFRLINEEGRELETISLRSR